MKTMLAMISALTLLTACGGSKEDASDHNDADVTFVQEMVPHHEQALEMAELVDARSSDADVAELATAILDAQTSEITTLEGWLDDWGVGSSSDGDHGDHGMMSDDDLDELESLTGTAFDRAWLTMMIEHHEGAVTAAEKVSDEGKNGDVAAFAREVARQQSDEIQQMRLLLEGAAA